MNNVFYEQNVIKRDIDERTKKTQTLTVAKTVLLMLGVLIDSSVFFLIGMETAQFFLFFFVLLGASVPFYVVSLLLGKANKKANTEYDYSLVETRLTVSAVFFRDRRKKLYEIDTAAMISIGAFVSETYKKYDNDNVKKVFALANYDDEDAVAYLVFDTPKGRMLMFFEPDSGMIAALRRAVGRFDVFDSSIKKVSENDLARAAEERRAAKERSERNANRYGGERADESEEGAQEDETIGEESDNVEDGEGADESEEGAQENETIGEENDNEEDGERADESATKSKSADKKTSEKTSGKSSEDSKNEKASARKSVNASADGNTSKKEDKELSKKAKTTKQK